jgi:hypothetical protein
MVQKKILLWPSHDPDQYIKIADLLVQNNPNLSLKLFFLKKPKVKITHEYITYESLIESCDMPEDELVRTSPVNFNELILTDRIHKKNQNLRYVLARFIFSLKDYLKSNEIDSVFGYAVSDSITYGCYKLCKQLNIPYYFLIGSKIQDYFYISSNLNGYPETSNIQSLSIKESKKLIKRVVQDQVSPKYASDKSMLANKPLLQSLKSMTSLLSARILQKNKYLDVEMALKTALIRKCRQQLSFMELKRLSENFENLNNKKFIYFPLHLHPETATLIWGRWIHDQLELIKIISRVIPNDCYIFVKEHKVAAGRHELGFYQKISNLPNVKILEMNTNSFEISSWASAVATISGTAGFEALCQNKKVLLFGDADYANLPNVIKCYDLSKIRENVTQAFSLPNLENSDIFENHVFLEYVQMKLNSSIALDDYSANSVDSDLISKLTMLFEEKIFN